MADSPPLLQMFWHTTDGDTTTALKFRFTSPFCLVPYVKCRITNNHHIWVSFKPISNHLSIQYSITESRDHNCRHRAMVLQKSMSDTRFSLASVATVNFIWLLTNDESTLMIPCIVTPALQQAEVPYTACDLACKSHHTALFFFFTVWAKFHVDSLSGPWLLS